MKTQGTVKWFNEKRGYGFILDAEGVEYFFHYRDIVMPGFQTLMDGQSVLFSPEETSNGPIAKSIIPVGNNL